MTELAETSRARIIVVCQDGPLAGETFTVTCLPQLVRCVRARDGVADILNEPDDAPRLDEEVHWYRWDGSGVGHVCVRHGRRRGCYAIAHLRHAPNLRGLQPPDPVNPGATVGKHPEGAIRHQAPEGAPNPKATA